MKKGFTLVELLVVIVILGLLALVAYPSVIKIINDYKKEAYESQIKIIEKVTKEWAVEHPRELPEINESAGTFSCTPPSKKCISIDKLIDEGYLSDKEIKNPKGGTINGGEEISCHCKDTCKYEYKYVDKETCDASKN